MNRKGLGVVMAVIVLITVVIAIASIAAGRMTSGVASLAAAIALACITDPIRRIVDPRYRKRVAR